MVTDIEVNAQWPPGSKESHLGKNANSHLGKLK